jgi:hypothetical protein
LGAAVEEGRFRVGSPAEALAGLFFFSWPRQPRNQSSRSRFGFAGTCPEEEVMARVRLIEELLLLTCMGAFVAGIAYAGVILLD